MNANLFRLKHVDYSEQSQRIEIIVDGVPKPQTVIFSGIDFFGEKYYLTEQGLRYIQDARFKLPWQSFVVNYLEKIPIILRTPKYVARRKHYPVRFFFYDWVAIRELDNQKCLLCIVLTKSNINVVWNFYWLESNKVPKTVEIIYKSKTTKKR